MQSDSTGARVKGKNHYTHVFASEFFAVFATMPEKSRLSILKALQGQSPEGLKLEYNQAAIEVLEHHKISNKDMIGIDQIFTRNKTLSQKLFEEVIAREKPWIAKKEQTYKRIIDSLSPGYFFGQTLYRPPNILITDDAREYQLLAPFHMLCWVHDARYYNKLMPVCAGHRNQLESFMEKYWDFYGLLKKFKICPKENL